jgi:AAA15 family ATPase/GTPase
MLRRFEVRNFKNFAGRFVFDLASTKNYEFNPECVQNGIAANSIIYGPNACGKTNLGYAVFDIKTHLTDEKIGDYYGANYLNASRGRDHAEFVYSFRFGNDEVEYTYRKESVRKLLSEVLKINGKTVVELDRTKGSVAEFNLEGTETLKSDLGSGPMDSERVLSAVRYVANSTVLTDTSENRVFREFTVFVDNMQHFTTETARDVKAPASDSTRIITLLAGGLERFEQFLGQAGVACKLTTVEVSGEKRIAFDFGTTQLDFLANASTGTLSLTAQYIQLVNLHLLDQHAQKIQQYGTKQSSENVEGNIMFLPRVKPFLFVDEFDAFYHHAAARHMVEMLKKLHCQSVLTTHNTSIMSNDLLRPDCYFIMSATDIKPAYAFTDKELRKAHNIEKMYRAGVFGG